MIEAQTPAKGSIPEQARAVIIGGGVIGASIAYHLAKVGWTDTILLERRSSRCWWRTPNRSSTAASRCTGPVATWGT